MKTHKKIGLGLVFLSVVLLSVVFLFPKKSLAATFNAQDLKNATYTFQDGANISAKGIFSPSAVIFTDSNITDTNRNFKPIGDSTFCSNGVDNFGINISDNADLSRATITAKINVGEPVGNNCTPLSQTITIDNPNQLAKTGYQWNSAQIISLNGSSNSITFTQVTNGNNVAFADISSGVCGVSNFILLSQPNGNSGNLYELSDITPSQRGSGTKSKNLPAALQTWLSVESCHLDKGPTAITIAGQAGKAAAGGAGTVNPVGDSCELDSGGFALSWLMCPVLASANDLVNGVNGNGGLIGQFEKQLSFNVSRDLGVVGGGGNEVQTTWSLIKNITTAALVIIMLVMIFSQAISAGPFDAYTVRKILPRLVAAVILMQLSWYIVAWIVDIVDDIGNSLFDLLYAPFGGSTQLDLGHLLSHAGLGSGGLAVINWVALVGLVVLGLAALPTVLFLAFAAIVALFTALVVLIFRKIIIIFCLIFAPLAILAWILPGTQRYWKLWYDNFIKVLFMFPLVVGLIAAGHIFAFIVGTQGNGTFLNLIFIMVGVFGPLFLLPKTFKWGGQAMTLAGGAINNVSSRLQKAGQEPIKGYAQRMQGAGAKKYDPQANWRSKAARRIQSGHILPTERSRRLTIAAGDKWAAERNDEANALVGRTFEKAMSEGYVDGNGRKWEAGVGAAKQALVDIAGNDGKSDTDKRAAQAAIKQLIDTSSWIELQNNQITKGSNAGKRTFQVPLWESTITTSPEHYPKVLGKRPDMIPHMLQKTYGADEAKVRENLDSFGLYSDETMDRLNIQGEERERIKQNREIRFNGIMETMRSNGNKPVRLSDSDRMIATIKDQMSAGDFANVAQGFFQEVDRLGATNPQEGSRVSAALRQQLEQIEQAGLPGQQILSPLSVGTMAEDINKALAHEGPAARNIESFVHTPSTRQAPTQERPPSPSTTPPSADTGGASPGASQSSVRPSPAGGFTYTPTQGTNTFEVEIPVNQEDNNPPPPDDQSGPRPT